MLQHSHKTEDNKSELGEPENPESELEVDQPKEVKEVTQEDVTRLNEERWPNVNGVYDAEGEWHDWSDITYSYSYENSELIIWPYTVCIINLPGQQYVTESTIN